MSKVYINKNVLEVAKERYKIIFDKFENVFVSVSAGKDSTVLYHLALEEAKKRDRKINVFFLDQEAEYRSTIELMRKMMDDPHVIPHWFQVPLYMTNSTSYEEDMLYAWGPGEDWMRDREEMSIKEIEDDYPKRFYKFFEWFEGKQPDNTAFLVGLRADESLNRFRAVSKNPGYKNIKWSTETKKGNSYKIYPLYDWGHGDIWKYIDDNNLDYNKIYDKMFRNNHNIYNTMRVSNLIHEKAFKCLSDLQKLEPETYDKLIKRIKGTHVAARYAHKEYIYNNKKLPDRFETWEDYRNFLLKTAPISKKERFIKRFENQPKEEYIYKQQCKQLLLNDWENNLGVKKRNKTKKKRNLKKWKEIL